MADVNPTIYDSSHPTLPMPQGVILVVWSGINTTDRKGKAVLLPDYPGKSVQVYGTFSAGSPSVAIEGANGPGTAGNPIAPPADADFNTLNDPSSTALTFTGQRAEEVMENMVWIRPNLTGGDGSTNLTVALLCVKVARR
jgi:hypothetical protein